MHSFEAPGMNAFQRHGIEHLSASQITTFSADPSRWFAQKVLGYRSPSSASMERGKAVETGIVRILSGDDISDATEFAVDQFDKSRRFGDLMTGDMAAEREHIAPMIKVGIDAVSGFGNPIWAEDGGQTKIEIPIRFGLGDNDVIPVIGFIDLLFADRVIDIKSTLRIPSEMSFSHRIQAAIYARTTNKPVQFVYVSPKKSSALEAADTSADQASVRAIVQRMAAFLSLSDSKETLRNAVPVIVDGFSWRGDEASRKEFYGI